MRRSTASTQNRPNPRAVLLPLMLASFAGCATQFEPPVPNRPESELDLVLANDEWNFDSVVLR